MPFSIPVVESSNNSHSHDMTHSSHPNLRVEASIPQGLRDEARLRLIRRQLVHLRLWQLVHLRLRQLFIHRAGIGHLGTGHNKGLTQRWGAEKLWKIRDR